MQVRLANQHPPNEARWIIDTTQVMRAIKVKETYKERFKTVTKF